jgi:hypothetical protein
MPEVRSNGKRTEKNTKQTTPTKLNIAALKM